MSLKLNVELLADYNQWMNNKIYNAAANLSRAELEKNRGAFFGSILGTLNHILVGDTIWLKRFADHPSNLVALDYVRSLDMPGALDDIVYPDFGELRAARERMDLVILDFARDLSEEHLLSSLAFSRMNGDCHIKKFSFVIQHFFNHQTHHRGQVTTLLSQAGLEFDATDLLLRVPDE